MGQPLITTPKHGEGHADHGEAQAGNKGPSVSGKLLSFLGTVPPHYEPLVAERSSRAEHLLRLPRKFDKSVTSSPLFKTLSRVFG